MKPLIKTILIISFLFTACFSCNKSETPSGKGSVEFSFSLKNNKKSSTGSPSWVVFSVRDASDNYIYNTEKIALLNFDGKYITSPISMTTGNYKLTAYFVLDENEEVIYSTPLENSELSYLVSDPLPIEFLVTKDVVINLSPEVISTQDLQPEDFGYITFSLNVVNTFNFLLSVFVYDSTSQNFILTDATLSVNANNQSLFSKQLEAVTNTITLSEDIDTVTLNVSKSGYNGYSKVFTTSELKAYLLSSESGPLKIILSKSEINLNDGLVAYYPFSGNANDESGYENHGTVENAVLCTDALGYDQQAYQFSGSYSRIYCNTDPIENEGDVSISVLYYPELDLTNNEFTPNDNRYIISSGAQSIRPGYFILWNNGKIWAGRHTSTYSIETLFGNYQPYNWYHIAFTYNNTSKNAQIFVNGELAADTVASYQEFTLNDYRQLIIGGPNTPFYDWDFIGKIDEVRIYNRVLSKPEIVELNNLR
jgi:hypothetical protein